MVALCLDCVELELGISFKAYLVKTHLTQTIPRISLHRPKTLAYSHCPDRIITDLWNVLTLSGGVMVTPSESCKTL